MKFNPGDLDTKVEILEMMDEENELHQQVHKEKVIKKVHAKVKDVRGNKYYDAKKIVPEITHFVYIRYNKKPVRQDMYIRHKGRKFEVKSCIDMYNEKTLYEIQCVYKVKKVKENVDEY
ncbi:MAG: phage head closure protein [Lachnospiraceae bacterium]